MDNAPFISVIIPTYNAGSYLNKAIDSIRAQQKVAKYNIEIIVSDDGSTDSSCDALPCDVVLIHNAHKCAAFARNEAIKISKGDYIMFLDADDLLTEDAIFSLMQEMVNNQKLDAVFGMAKDFISPELLKSNEILPLERPNPYGGVLPGCAILKKSVIDEIGPFDENLKSGETVSYMMNIRSHNYTIKTIENVTLLRRIHTTNTSITQKSQEMKNYAMAIRKKIMGNSSKENGYNTL